MKNLSWILVVILSIVVAMFAYKFTVGSVAPSDDGRQAVVISKDERNALLLEMRTWLMSAQGVLAAAVKDDMAEVAKIARVSGMSAEEETPASLFRKIPLEMKKLGFATRARFDDIAVLAETEKDREKIFALLSETMNNCIACHAVYRFIEETPSK
ncbi:MAG: hypothetical protein GQ470_02925 [Gammaproteobacteria bacterium]|nr:hypothetical protein [Gammaproteobacteria bacterium]